MDFWKNKNIKDKKLMNDIFKQQLEKLVEICPNFKIVSAVICYDKNSPHMKVIGVPIANYDKGLSKRVAKTKVFTKESLEILHNKMRENVEEQMKSFYGKDINLKSKEKGRNKDLLTKDYIAAKRTQENQLKKLKE
ncbi:plasmid recombination protein [Streptobacillus moniliformis]|uniref:plasmid recombination protein n=1 Tax=Streptobacillus moniliformis TaxID=34105 RepID=UPI0007E372D0|nr:plasmid recombination protein [Streptobacillus moniliformis]